MANGMIYIPVNASMKGFISEVQSGTTLAAQNGAKSFSSIFGKATKDAGKAASSNFGDGLSDIEKSTRKLADARNRDAAAAAKVTEAEAKLNALRERGNASQSQIMAAENRLETARAKSSATSAQLSRAESDLDKTKKGGSATNVQLARAEDQLRAAKIKVADSSQKVAIAEQKLAEARESGKPEKIASAEAGLLRARANAANATDDLTMKESKLAAVAKDVARSNDDSAQSFDEATAAMAKNGKELGILAGAMAGAGLAAGKVMLDLGTQFATMDNTIRIGTGATGAALDGLTDSARRVAATVPDMNGGMEHVGQVLADLNTRTGFTGRTLEELSKQFVNLGRLTGEEANINDITGAMSLFGVEADKATSTMDDLFRISQATGIGINQIASTLKSGGAGLKQFGFSMSDAAGLIGVLDKAGLDANKSIQGMSKAFVEVQKNGGDAREVFKSSIKQMEDFIKTGNKKEATEIAKKLFGTRGATQFITAIQDGKLQLSGLMESAGTTEDGINQLAEATLTWSEKWQLFKQNVVLALEPLASPVFDAVNVVMGALAANAQRSSEFFQQHATAIKVTMAAMAGLTGAVVAYKGLQFAGSVITAVKAMGGLRQVIQATGAAQAILNGIMNANPLMLIASLAIGAATAFGTFLATNEEFRNKVVGAFHQVGSVVSGAWGSMLDGGRAFGNWISGEWHATLDGFSTFFGYVGDTISSIWHGVGDTLSSVYHSTIEPVFTWLKDGISTIPRVFKGVANSLVHLFDPVMAVMRPPIHLLGNLLAGIPSHVGPIKIHGAERANQWGAQLQSFKTGGEIDGRARDNILKGGIPGQDSILLTDNAGIPTAIGMPGEMVINADATRKNTPLLEAINRGWTPSAEDLHAMFPNMPRFADGGVIRGKRTNEEMREFYSGHAPGNTAPSLQGSGYNASSPWGDCSWTVSAGARYMVGLTPPLTRGFATGTQESALKQYGYTMGIGAPGTFRIGWFNDPNAPGGGHTAATLPDGTNIEMRGGDGGHIGGAAIGYNDPMFTHHAYIWPAEASVKAGAAEAKAGEDTAKLVKPTEYKDSTSAGDNGVAPDSPAQALPPGTFNPGVFSESNAAGAGTWSDLIGGAAADVVKTTVSGHLSDILGVFGINDTLPPVMQAAVEAAGYVSQQNKQVAEEQSRAANGMSSAVSAESLAKMVRPYDASQTSEQWRDLYTSAIEYTKTTIDSVDRMIKQSDVVSRGNPKSLKRAGNGKDVRMGLFGLTAAQFAANKDAKLGANIFNPAANAVAALKHVAKVAGTPDELWPSPKFYYYGGKVSGAKGRDKIPAYLTDGEHVINAASASAAPTVTAAINSSPQFADDLEMGLRNSAASTIKGAGARLPELGSTVGESGTRIVYSGARAGLTATKNAANFMASFVPYYGDIIGSGADVLFDLGSAALNMTEEPVAQVAGFLGGEIGAAGSRMIDAGVDTLNANVPTLSSLMGGLSVPVPGVPIGSAFTPTPGSIETTTPIKESSVNRSDDDEKTTVIYLTQHFHGNSSDLQKIADREAARTAAGYGPLSRVGL